MNVLLIGSGGREHALAWALSASAKLGKLFCAPGNPGIAEIAECVSLDLASGAAVADFCRLQNVGLVVIGPEAPLVAGLADELRAAGIACFGPGREAAQLEGSKAFTKALCEEAGIPTAAYAHFTDADAAVAHARAQPLPVVIKADGIAAGKGVAIAGSHDEAEAFIRECFSGRFGDAGSEVVIEEFLEGEEASFFAITDGETVVPLATAQDHKRVGDGDTGPNTGGMGAYSPAPVMSEVMIRRTLDEIVIPTVRRLAERGTPYQGVLYAGLMITSDGPKLIEYNVRFGDPEAQVLMMRIDRPGFLDLIEAASIGTLAGHAPQWREDVAVTIVLAAEGYPGTPKKGGEIKGLEDLGNDDLMVFHAGTVRDAEGRLRANGGRVLNVTARGESVAAAREKAYAAVERIDWPDGFCRRDIGWRAVQREAE